MSLLLKFNLCPILGCTQLQFSENTGVYSTANTTGWGTPNAELVSALTATLKITNPSLVSYTIDLFDNAYPTSVEGFSYNIPLNEMGSPTSIVDGKWDFVYTVTLDTGVIYTTSQSLYFTCNTKCCVSNMLANVNTCDSCPKDDSEKNYNTVKTMFDSLENAAECGDETTFVSIKKIIDKLCLNSGCKTCK